MTEDQKEFAATAIRQDMEELSTEQLQVICETAKDVLRERGSYLEECY